MIMMRPLFAIALCAMLVFAPAIVHAAADATAEAVEDAHNPAGPAFVTPEAENPIEAAEDHGGGGLPQLNVHTYPSQIFWLMVMFVGLYVAFSRAVLPMIGGVVHGRESMIKGNLEEAQKLKEQAEAIQIAYEKNLEAARAKAVQAVQDVEAASKKKASDQIDSFRQKSDKEIGAAEDRVQGAKNKAMGDMTAVAAEVASIAAEKITGIGTDRQKAQAIVETIAGKAKAA